MAQKQVRSTQPSARVFRRRRLAVLISLLVVLGLLAWAGFGIAALLRPDSAPGSVADPSAVGAPGATTGTTEVQESSSEPTGCLEGDVAVIASTVQTTHGPSENPVLVMSIKNQGKFDCMVDVGTSQQEFAVMSGKDRIFATSDCVQDPSDTNIVIKSGASETARFTWTRVRSAPGCKVVNSKPRPGTYGFTAKLGEISSETVKFELK